MSKVLNNYTIYLVVVVILVLGVVDYYYPFLHHSSTELLDEIREKKQVEAVKKSAKDEIAEIEENSEIKVNTQLGGIDEVNADNKATGMDERKKLAFQNNSLGHLGNDVKEGFESNPSQVVLKLFYKTNCGYSQQFLPNWYELTRMLPSGVSFEEINCDQYDEFGITQCSKYQISKVPTLQLVTTDEDGEETIEEFVGSRTYLNVKEWLGKLGVSLRKNFDAEHFAEVGGKHHHQIMRDEDGSYEDHRDELRRNVTLKDNMGNYRDVEDGCYIASFSKCKEGSQNPGYQIFTQRGQYGCVHPDVHTSMNDGFEAAFASAASYLDNLPPKQDPKTGKLLPYQGDEKKQQMMNCAVKYGNQFKQFDLCDGERLAEKYLIPQRLEDGEVVLPQGMTKEDYVKTKDIAESLMVGACGMSS
jgi:thiol-disulfide isomerase/thioredoxin